MKRNIFILIIVVLFSSITLQAQTNSANKQQTKKSKSSLVVFVVGLENYQVSDYLTSLIGNELARKGSYEIIPRTETVKRKLDELRKYEDDGHINDRELIEWGHQHNVSVLCLVQAVQLDEYLFSAQLTDVKSNTLIGSAEYIIPTISGSDLKKAASALAAQMKTKNTKDKKLNK
ncbi:MAG: hypothetical protein LBD76_08180 [Prevotellaceae bacterium]|jgi:hypothetical protein|nr:hypothetical protein [Prevotellaceae bacterium]